MQNHNKAVVVEEFRLGRCSMKVVAMEMVEKNNEMLQVCSSHRELKDPGEQHLILG